MHNYHRLQQNVYHRCDCTKVIIMRRLSILFNNSCCLMFSIFYMFHVYVNVFIYIYIYMYFRRYGFMYVRMYVCMYVCMYVRTYACMYLCMYACMYVCMYVCITFICTRCRRLVASIQKLLHRVWSICQRQNLGYLGWLLNHLSFYFISLWDSRTKYWLAESQGC